MLSFKANPPQETFVIQFPPHIKNLFFIVGSPAEDGKENSSHIFFSRVSSREEKSRYKEKHEENLMQFARQIKNTLRLSK